MSSFRMNAIQTVEYILGAVLGKRREIDAAVLLKFINNRKFEICIKDFMRSLSGYSRAPNIVEFLLLCMSSKSWSIRDDAVEGLAIAKVKTDAVRMALRNALSDSNWIVRCSAMKALGERGDVGATELIIRRYASRNAIEKNWVLISLTQMKNSNSEDFLRRAFTRAKSKDHKYLAAGALASLGNVDFRDYLTSSRKTETNEDNKDTLDQILEWLETNC